MGFGGRGIGGNLKLGKDTHFCPKQARSGGDGKGAESNFPEKAFLIFFMKRNLPDLRCLGMSFLLLSGYGIGFRFRV